MPLISRKCNSYLLRYARIILLSCGALFSGPVFGQWTNPYTGGSFNNPLSSTLDTVILHRMQQQMLERQILGPQVPASQRTVAPPPQVSQPGMVMPPPTAVKVRYPITATDFIPGPRMVPAILAAGAPPQQQAQLLQAFGQFLDSFEKEARKNNIAYALAWLLGASAQVHTGRVIPDPVAEQLALDINDILASSPNFKTLPVIKKQQLYESSVLVGAIVATLAADPQTQDQGKFLARQVLQSLGGVI